MMHSLQPSFKHAPWSDLRMCKVEPFSFSLLVWRTNSVAVARSALGDWRRFLLFIIAGQMHGRARPCICAFLRQGKSC